jgi:hypothetical protein
MNPVAKRTLFAGLLICLAGTAFTDLGAEPVGGPGGPGGNVGVGVAQGPRFVVNVLTFKALDETGWDWTGADEVVFTFKTPRYALITVEYGSINSDDTEHTFKRRDTCVEPAVDDDGEYDHRWQCHDAGMPAPLSFVIGAYEQDVQPWFGFCATQYADTDIRVPNLGICEEGSPNDLIGKEDVQYSLQTLLTKLPQVGGFFTERLDLFGGCDGSTMSEGCSGPESPHYVLVYKVTRLPDAVAPPVNPNP